MQKSMIAFNEARLNTWMPNCFRHYRRGVIAQSFRNLNGLGSTFQSKRSGPLQKIFITAGIALLLGLASPGLGAALNCTTYKEKTLGRLQTLCSDGTRTTSYWNRTLERWETTVQPAPGTRWSCTTQRHP
jgi:hypothetical protein